MQSMSYRQWPSCLIALIVFLTSTIIEPPADAGGAALAPIQAVIKNRLDDKIKAQGLSCRGEMICGMQMLPLAYRSRQYLPFWIDGSLRLEAAEALAEAIGRAGEDGLVPSDYHLAAIHDLLAEICERLSVNELIPVDWWADLDLVLSDAFLIYGSHLAAGRVDPETLYTDWRIDPRTLKLLPFLVQAASTGDVERALNQLRPTHGGYANLRNALVRLHALAAAGGWPVLALQPMLRPGDRGSAVYALRCRLDVSDDVDPSATADPSVFDATLVAAVNRFQRRHGLKADGIVGPDTYARLNVSVQRRIRQVGLNLERWRWLPHHLGNRYIIVNTADFTLNAIDNGRLALTMRVVVGRPARRSPVFSAKMGHLVINPYWNVPTTIAVEDILPKVQKDVAHLNRQGIRVFRSWNAVAPEVDPATVNWQAYHADRFPFGLRQDPGPQNALGRIKFMFPNEFAVYLHDTPDRALFEQVQRDLSSGCIRVEAPVALADFVLAGDDRWTSETLQEVIEIGETKTIRIDHPIPVHLLYMTAWTDESGSLQFRGDIYGLDDGLARALTRRRPRKLPGFVRQEDH